MYAIIIIDNGHLLLTNHSSDQYVFNLVHFLSRSFRILQA